MQHFLIVQYEVMVGRTKALRCSKVTFSFMVTQQNYVVRFSKVALVSTRRCPWHGSLASQQNSAAQPSRVSQRCRAAQRSCVALKEVSTIEQRSVAKMRRVAHSIEDAQYFIVVKRLHYFILVNKIKILLVFYWLHYCVY